MALDANLEFQSCITGFTCKAGKLSISKAAVTFTSEKGEQVFTAVPKDVALTGPNRTKVMLSDKIAVTLEVASLGKKWKISFVAPGVRGCQKTASYLCPEPGPERQEDLIAYVKGRVDGLGRGEVPSVPAAVPPAPKVVFVQPVAPADGAPSQRFGAGSDAGSHAGADYSVTKERATAHAIADGVVEKLVANGTGCPPGKTGPGVGCADHGLGNVVIIKHDSPDGRGSIYSLYAHLDSIAPGVDVGSQVKAGQGIGVVGASGYGVAQYWRKPPADGLCGNYAKGAPCTHLHLEVKDAAVLENPAGGSACKGTPCWGYVPGDPKQFGYRDPASLLNSAASADARPTP